MVDIPRYNTFVKKEPINKGWSNDKKYYIETSDGQKLLLRISNISLYDKKKAEYEAVINASGLGINMSLPIDFGICSGGREVYMLLTWVEGEDAEVILPSLSESRQYEIGIEAGTALKKIHSIKAPEGQPNWEKRIRNKVAKKLTEYKTCGYIVPHDDNILKFIEENLKFLKDCEYVMLHGDFHVGNLIIDKTGNLGVIDFNRFEYGDPYEEFNRLMAVSIAMRIIAKNRLK